jgi:hypothetical protein
VNEWWQDQLSELRHHWGGQGGAYAVNYLPGCDTWMAQRADDGATLRADSAAALRDLIVADYTARPVPRQRDGPTGTV